MHSDLVLAADVASGRRFEAAGAGRHGTLLIRGATVSGQLSLEGAHVRRGHAPGRRPGQQVRDEIEQHSPAGLTAITTILRGCDCEPVGGDGSQGAVCLSNTTVGGRLALRNAFLSNDTGPALMADYLTVKDDAAGCEEARNGLTAIGCGASGAVCLAAATINGQLSLSGSTLANATGPALVADFAQINGGVLLDQGFVAVGTGPAGAVCLTDASVGRELRCAGRFVSPAEAGGAPLVALNLTRTRAGTLQLGDQHHGFLLDGLLELDGLSYTGLPGLGDLDRLGPRPPGGHGRSWRTVRSGRAAGPHGDNVAQWLWWLRRCTTQYRAQPYEALAAAYGGAGYDDLARRILVAQRDDVRDRGSLSPVRKLGQYCAKWLTGYGYHCFYAFLWLAGLFTVTALVAVFWLGPQKYIVPGPAAGTAPVAGASASGQAQPGRRRLPPSPGRPASRPRPPPWPRRPARRRRPGPRLRPGPRRRPGPRLRSAHRRRPLGRHGQPAGGGAVGLAHRAHPGWPGPGRRRPVRQAVLRPGPGRLRDRARLSPHQPEQQCGGSVRRPGHRGRGRGRGLRLGGPRRGSHPARPLHPRADRRHTQPARRGLTGGTGPAPVRVGCRAQP